MKAPELLLPAGTLDKMRAAYDFGADAVYAGQPRYSLRARNNDFKLEELKQGIDEAHARGKLFFVASNILPHNSKIKTYMADMEPVIAMKPDALIMADPGLIMMVREKWPEVPIHLSVQANTVNYMGVKFWQKLGVSRIILSRELSLDEIAEIRQQCPDIELEVFVHGALCIAYSGRCLLSGYFNHRDPNQGTCTNACRWDYKVHDTQGDDAGDVQTIKFDFNKALEEANQSFASCGGAERHPLADKTYLIEEGSRPGELMPIIEDEHGTYIMNSKDLRAVEQVEKLAKIGVDSLKIEGRTKSLYYVARAAQVYRKAIDDAVAGRPFDLGLLAELDGLANRGYTPGFLERHQTQEYQNYITGHSKAKQSQYVGDVLSVDAEGWALIEVKNRFAVGDRIEVIHPSGNQIIELAQMTRNDQPVSVAAGNGMQVKIPGMQGKEKALLARLF
ncbi:MULTISPECIES: tRNA 5-hydroxyuridine modification protein YegQ [Chromobacterium]|uniref:tRNA 5-hydroxyuridine modification protein YegQ n=2 Tax=Chromobacterium TaxID=535 RepID=A0ABS3GQM8_9NEIS|nr:MULTISPECIES: tRNA 5-hydroxyuridine modification protein YegQ [Chromobacterium]AXT46996.1 U32 family peptidase [Chromobacterium rhizoryzae]MBK0415629.1 tRNA 5-hydroxyuridine modification protein YegQ [Chromobacterium haemolyticum]MBO0417043.1 tRNA 5-hydroxyuridine modification protein YegQ [Chromobacterium haemolyticum]MBO0500246.1 tRNA 5-hydroxyuridine modification protein YegQ [Chromobacterium haemolyticum]MDH0342787.1 tRNA 5-hydroxyuridine modification protein YegQ [Chromobacterium haemo